MPPPRGIKRQTGVDTGPHDRRNLRLGVGRDDHEGHLHAPVGRIRRVRDPRQTAEVQIVLVRDPGERLAQTRALSLLLLEPVRKALHRRPRCGQKLAGLLVLVEPQLELIEPMRQRLKQQTATLGVVEQVVLQIRVARHHPHVPEHLEEHSRRAPGPAAAAQLLDQAPQGLAEETDDNLPVGEGGVVVRDLADPLLGSGGHIDSVIGSSFVHCTKWYSKGH